MERTRRTFVQAALYSNIARALPTDLDASLTKNVNDKLRRLHYVQIDVFTSERLTGNPLCVFTDARGLSDSEMQDLARETNLQETTFVLPRDAGVRPKDGVRVRIFTPVEELPFAGHPTLLARQIPRK